MTARKPGASELGTRIEERLTRLYYETDLETIAEALGSLEPILEGHFKHEEGENGSFARLREMLPEKADQVDAFIREHGEILQKVRHLRSEFSDLSSRLDEAHGAMKELSEAITSHEETEAALSREAMERRS